VEKRSARVMAMTPVVSSIPRVLKDQHAWVVWRYEPSPSTPGKLTKVPYSAHGGKAESNNPETWASFREALEYHLENDWTDGVGVVVSDADDFVGIDLDHCLNAETGEVAEWARNVVDTVNSYTEITPSGEGLRIFARGSLPPRGRKKNDFEIYENGRYLTVTGRHLEGTPLTVESRELQIRRVHREIWPDPVREVQLPRTPQRLSNLSDADLIEKAQAAVNGSKFSALWSGNHSEYGSQSEADLALCNLLAFWTGGDAGRVDALFRSSGLFRSEKWDTRHFSDGRTYGQGTVDEALRLTTTYYSPPLVGAVIGRIAMSEPVPGQPEQALVVRALTETGNAERLVDQYGTDMRFCHPWGAWLHWDGHRWKRDQTGAIRAWAKTVVRSIYSEITAAETKDERATLFKWAVKSETAAARTAMIKLAESETNIPIEPEAMDRDPFLLNVMNGTVDLKTGQLRQHERADCITKLAPVYFDPEAECPTFLAFLDRVIPDLEVRRFLRRITGYGMTGITSEQCIAFFYGGGANGKSTFLDVIQDMLGDYAQTAAPDLLVSRGGDRHPTELADLFGARWVSSIEVDEGKRLAETLVKQMTGGDKMKARFMRTDFFQWSPTHKLFLAANHKPEIRGTDYAIWRRIRMIPFTVTIPEAERDGNLGTKLRNELPGILNWALQGCKEWQEQGLGIPDAVREATEEYRQEQDVIGRFMEDSCVVDAQSFVNSGMLFKTYSVWCEASANRPVTTTAFGRRMAEKGFTAGRGVDGKRIWKGVRLRGAAE
jgi:putative DNA primase/helicase